MSNMRSPEEKEMILKDYLSGTGIMEIEKKYSVNNAVVYRWLKNYNEFGICKSQYKIVGKVENKNVGLM